MPGVLAYMSYSYQQRHLDLIAITVDIEILVKLDYFEDFISMLHVMRCFTFFKKLLIF